MYLSTRVPGFHLGGGCFYCRRCFCLGGGWCFTGRCCRRWSARGGLAGHGRGSQRDRRQIDWTHHSQPEQFPKDPAALVLSDRRVSLIGCDLEPGCLLVAPAEKKTGVHQERLPQWRVDRARSRAHIDGIRILRQDTKPKPAEGLICRRGGERRVLRWGQRECWRKSDRSALRGGWTDRGCINFPCGCGNCRGGSCW